MKKAVVLLVLIGVIITISNKSTETVEDVIEIQSKVKQEDLSKSQKDSNKEVSSLIVDSALNNFRLRYRDKKFFIYDGRDKYFEIVKFSGMVDDLKIALDNQPFDTVITSDGEKLVVISKGKRIYLEETKPDFKYSEWKSEVLKESE